ncbi:MAG: hypothetical protein IKH14_08090 [Prevotella sp.]|nr:hypothetical protein [Prevotella sp.]
MAIYYKLIKNQIKSSKNYGKYYAHTVKQGKVSMEQIEQTIQENCTAKASDVRLVLRELFDTVKQYMQDGYVVELREMGKFHISVQSTPVDDPKNFSTDRHITGFKCNYTPYGERYKAGEGERARHIHREMTDGCEAKPQEEYKY